MKPYLNRVTAPAETPVSIADIKTHLRITNVTEDAFLTALIEAAVGTIDGRDGWLGRALISQTWKLTIPGFPPGAGRFRHFAAHCSNEAAIILPLPPLQSVVSIKYTNAAGSLITVDPATYRLNTDAEPGWVEPVYGGAWPSDMRSHSEGVAIEFVAGYGDDGDDIEPTIIHYIKLAVGDYYRDRETTVLGTILPQPVPQFQSMLENYRVRGAMNYDGWQA